MKRLSKKQIIIIISVAIAIIALAIVGIMFGINNGKKKETAKGDEKIESVEKDEADEEEREEDKTDAVEDETTRGTTEQEANTQTPVVEEPKQETQQQTTTNANQNQNQNNNSNTGNNSGSNTGNSGGSTTTPTPTPTPTPEPEESPYAVMDDAAKSRLLQCYNILCSGIASQYVPATHEYNTVSYWDDTIVLCANATSGTWMYVLIKGWYADTTNIGSDETRPGYTEIPSLVKQCLEALAPEGGTELYYTINSLVSQYGVCSQIPTQGRISESIPGLSVTLVDGKNGLEIFFWAE